MGSLLPWPVSVGLPCHKGAVMSGILFDLVHPADVLFFLNPIKHFHMLNVPVTIASRHKDVTVALLDQFGLDHEAVSTAGSGVIGLGTELIQRDWNLWRLARKTKPDVMTGFGGVGISHVGAVTGIPSVSFYDTDFAPLQTKLTLPFISEWHVPECYNGPEPKASRLHRFNGLKELSYFHPDNFKPDRELALKNGVAAEGDTFLIRLVQWRANHDVGLKGWAKETVAKVVQVLSEKGKVLISSESALPNELKQYEYTGAANQLHHVMAACRLVIGESATMGTEAAILGVPAIITVEVDLGYLRELDEVGLISWCRTMSKQQILAALDAQLAKTKEQHKQRWLPYIEHKLNVSDYVIQQLSKHIKGSAVSR